MDFLDFLDDNGWSEEMNDTPELESSPMSTSESYTSDNDDDDNNNKNSYSEEEEEEHKIYRKKSSDGNPFPKSEDEDDLLLDVERKSAPSTASAKCSVSKKDAEVLAKVRQLKLIPAERGEIDETINRWYRKNFGIFPQGFVFRAQGSVDGVMLFGARCIRCSVPREKNYVFVKDGSDLVKLKHFVAKHIAGEIKRQRSFAAASQYMMTFN